MNSFQSGVIGLEAPHPASARQFDSIPVTTTVAQTLPSFATPPPTDRETGTSEGFDDPDRDATQDRIPDPAKLALATSGTSVPKSEVSEANDDTAGRSITGDDIEVRPRYNVNKTPHPTPKRARKTGTIDGAAVIHPDLPTVVPTLNGQGWVELRCHFCNGNMNSLGKQLLKGTHGFKIHYRSRHSDKFGHDERVTLLYVLEHASYYELTPEEAKRVWKGDASAYHVEQVMGNPAACTSAPRKKKEAA